MVESEGQLLNLINKIKAGTRPVTYGEAATKQAVILPVISCLKWDTYNIEEVFPEFSVGSKKVDYALRNNGYNKVFIEVKKIGEDLEKHQEQLLNYSFQEGIKLAILTNGITWWLYLPLHEGSWEQRKFYTIEIYDQDSKEITQKFIDFLSKEKVISGKSVDNAENIYRSRQKQNLIRETLPKAWNKIIDESDEILIELIAETTEKLCGYKPDYAIVERFIISNIKKIDIFLPPGPVVVNPPEEPGGTIENYSNRTISSFVFKGTKYEVKSWKGMLLQVCKIMSSAHKERFERVLSLRGRKRPYFTKNPNELRSPERINSTDVYVEVNMSANSIVKLSINVLSLFGYKKEDIAIRFQ